MQASYQHHKFFEPVEKYPWKLCRGDIGQNLDTLSGITTNFEDPTTEHIFQLLKLGASRAAERLGLCC